MTDILVNFAKTQQQIAHLKPGVTLLAVSKSKSAAMIESLYYAGQKNFGENYLQEALEKIKQLQHLEIIWHFIGAIQSNKTRQIGQYFHWVHSVDRLKIARRLSAQRPKSAAPLNICLQVNIDKASIKSGVTTAQLPTLIAAVQTLPNLKLRGLMCMPDPKHTESAFIEMQALFKRFSQLDTLSMGMSADMALAIKYGATIVRVGQAIFGKR